MAAVARVAVGDGVAARVEGAVGVQQAEVGRAAAREAVREAVLGGKPAVVVCAKVGGGSVRSVRLGNVLPEGGDIYGS